MQFGALGQLPLVAGEERLRPEVFLRKIRGVGDYVAGDVQVIHANVRSLHRDDRGPLGRPPEVIHLPEGPGSVPGGRQVDEVDAPVSDRRFYRRLDGDMDVPAEDVAHVPVAGESLQQQPLDVGLFGVVDQRIDTDGVDGYVLKKDRRSVPVAFQVALQPVEVVGVGLPEIPPQRVRPDDVVESTEIEGVGQLFHPVQPPLGGKVVVEGRHIVTGGKLGRVARFVVADLQ